MTPAEVLFKHEEHDCELCLDGPPVCDAFKVACYALEQLDAAAALAAQLITERDES